MTYREYTVHNAETGIDELCQALRLLHVGWFGDARFYFRAAETSLSNALYWLKRDKATS